MESLSFRKRLFSFPGSFSDEHCDPRTVTVDHDKLAEGEKSCRYEKNKTNDRRYHGGLGLSRETIVKGLKVKAKFKLVSRCKCVSGFAYYFRLYRLYLFYTFFETTEESTSFVQLALLRQTSA